MMTSIIKEWIKEHKLLSCVLISAIMQGFILISYEFGIGGERSKNYIPMTIMPYVETLPEQRKQIVKKIEETDAKEEAEDEPANDKKTVENQSNIKSNKADFMSYVRVDEIAVSKGSLVPEYPDMAKDAGVTGLVILEVHIDDKGIVQKVKVIKGLGFGCDESAIKKVCSRRFIPAKMRGEAVAVRQRITFEFKIRK